MTETIPLGLCQCGCGEETTVPTKNHKRSGRVKGVPIQYVRGHWGKAQRFCPKGHDTYLYGRNKKRQDGEVGPCKVCAKQYHLNRNYGISLEEFEDILKAQNGKCAICGRNLSLTKTIVVGTNLGRAEVDHRHVPKSVKPQPDKKTLVRGLLCGGRYAGCNAKLGHVDNVEWLRAAANYVENPPAQKVLKRKQ